MLDNAVLDLIPRLPGSAGLVLLALARRWNYSNQIATKPWLMEQTTKSEPVVRTALKHLESIKLAQYVESRGGWLFFARRSVEFNVRFNVEFNVNFNTFTPHKARAGRAFRGVGKTWKDFEVSLSSGRRKKIKSSSFCLQPWESIPASLTK